MRAQTNSTVREDPWVPTPRLRLREFELFRKLVLKSCGIKLSDAKSLLVQNRLGRRLRLLRIDSFEEYHRFLISPEGKRKELANFLSALTTNETHFFREPHHFDVLKRRILPEIVSKRPNMATLRVWSAGCSTGQEAYTLAMVLDEWTQSNGKWRYSVLGSDIDWRVLEVAAGAEYPWDLKKEIPSKYFVRYVEASKEVLRIKPELRRRVSFQCHNFAQLSPQRPRLDVIFCRNAMMYLDRATRLHLARVFRDSLLDGGFLLLGSSESLHGLPRLFHAERINRTLVYQKRDDLEVSE